MEHFKPPSAMTLTGNVSENWHKWEQRFVLYMTAAELSKKSMTVQVAVLLHSLGEDALEIYNTFEIAKDKPEEVTRFWKLSETTAHLKRMWCLRDISSGHA